MGYTYVCDDGDWRICWGRKLLPYGEPGLKNDDRTLMGTHISIPALRQYQVVPAQNDIREARSHLVFFPSSFFLRFATGMIQRA